MCREGKDNIPHCRPGNGADFIYSGDEKSDTDENCREKRCCQKKKDDKKLRSGNSKQRRPTDSSGSDEGDSDDNQDNKPERKKVEAIAAEQRTAGGYSAKIGIPTQNVPLETRLLHYGIAWTSRVLVVSPNLVMTNASREGVRAGCSWFVR